MNIFYYKQEISFAVIISIMFTFDIFWNKIHFMKTFMNKNWLKVVAIILLLGALYSFPYAYYQIMEWVVVGGALMTSYQAYQQKKMFMVWLFAFVAVVFNPLAPLYLGTLIWQVVDITAAVLFVVSFLVLKEKTGKKKR
jgi:FtsH-binding integral membrane protein